MLGGWCSSSWGWSLLGIGRLTGEIPGTIPKKTNTRRGDREGEGVREGESWMVEDWGQGYFPVLFSDKWNMVFTHANTVCCQRNTKAGSWNFMETFVYSEQKERETLKLTLEEL